MIAHAEAPPRPARTRKLAAGVLPMLVLASLVSGCSWTRLYYYDAATYTHLTELKPRVSALYETFTSDSVDTDGIKEVRLALAQAYEYEKGKGVTNDETARQFEIIREMFERHVDHRLKDGRWSGAFLQNARENMDQAFDIAIATEALKNRNR